MRQETYLIQKSEVDQKIQQKLAQGLIQKQLEYLRLKEYLLLTAFVMIAAALRVPMQIVPSAEPIIFFAILSGWLFGARKGLIVGVSALWVSNFLVIGGQGPWTIFQLVAFGIAGSLGGLLRKKATKLEVITVVVLATVIFELVVNTSSLFFFGFNLWAAFIPALPFGIVHLATNVSFALILHKAKKLSEKKGGFDKREICQELLNKLKIKKSNERK